MIISSIWIIHLWHQKNLMYNWFQKVVECPANGVAGFHDNPLLTALLDMLYARALQMCDVCKEVEQRRRNATFCCIRCMLLLSPHANYNVFDQWQVHWSSSWCLVLSVPYLYQCSQKFHVTIWFCSLWQVMHVNHELIKANLWKWSSLIFYSIFLSS